jgi:glyoxylase-like metal-dependent hydrolase (beta-lactamase superfamily II)
MVYTDGMIEEVASHVFQICVPIPFPLKTVNMYALVGKQGWVLVDTALNTPEIWQTLATDLQQVGLVLTDLRAIVLTHSHPDHIGLSGALYERYHVPIYLHPLDTQSLYTLWSENSPGQAAYIKRSTHFLALHGLTATPYWNLRDPSRTNNPLLTIPPRTALQPLADGQQIELADEIYQVIWTPGHSEGQVCLFRARDGIFLSADHVLPRITPTVGLYSFEDRPDPLGDYLQSLHKVASLPAQCTLPGHGNVFIKSQESAERIAEIIEHHQHRLQKILALLAQKPQQANQLMQQLFGTRLQDDSSRRMALAEVVAHLEYLRLRNQVKRQETEASILYSVVS